MDANALDELAERIAESFGVPVALIRRELEGMHSVYAMQDPDRANESRS